MLEIGTRQEISEIVKGEMSARQVGSGELDVLATPILISLVEKCVWTSIENELEDNLTTVGININLNHIAPTPIGMKINIQTELIEIDRKRLKFSFVVYDDKEEIANGTHERFIVDKVVFQNKAKEKNN